MGNTQLFQIPFNDDDRFDTSRIDTKNSDDFDTFSFDNINEERDGYKDIHEEKDTSNDGNFNNSKIRNHAFDSTVDNSQADIIDLPNDTKKHDDNNLSPGARLRQARERKKLSLQEIAEQLFLDVNLVEKLEANNYESLAAPPIFVRGYMRNYAKLVDIPEEEFLESFDDLNRGQRSRSKKRTNSTKSVTNYQELLPHIGIVVLIILIVLIASLNLFSNENENVEDTPAIVEVQQPDYSEELSANIQNQASETMEEFQHGVEIRSDNPTDSTVVTLDQTAAVADDVATPTTTEEEQQTVIDVPITPTKESLRVHLKEKVWMRISDSSKERLFSGIAKTGNVLNLEGKPPFYLRTARDGLDIEYQGETKEITSYPKTQRDGKKVFVIGSDEQQN